jgi:hypothetical protein
MKARRILVGVGIAAALLGAAIAFKAREWQATWTTVQAYLYGYPLITADITRQVMTGPGEWNLPGAKRKLGYAPINQFGHARSFPDHHFTEVVAPNADTLYSTAWLDLKREPMVISTPDMGNRWLLMRVLDGWSSAFASLGTRVYGGAARDYVIVGPGWKGTLPEGLTRIDAATASAWIIATTYTRDAADFAAVHALQDQYRVTPLSAWGKPDTPEAPGTQRNPAIDHDTPVVTQVARLDAQAYFGRLAQLMVDNPPYAEDAPMRAKLASIGVRPGQPFALAAQDAATQRGIERGIALVKGLFEARSPGTQGPLAQLRTEVWAFDKLVALINQRVLNIKDGWLLPLNLGQYEQRYAQRALVTLIGFGANGPKDAVYPSTAIDADGEPLHGSRSYVLRFPKGALPPARDFWSLTMYDDRMFFTENAIGRHAIGDRHALKTNADGSTDILIQHETPGPEAQSNWLPAPSGPFKLMLRLYGPEAQVLENRWSPPKVVKNRIPED